MSASCAVERCQRSAAARSRYCPLHKCKSCARRRAAKSTYCAIHRKRTRTARIRKKAVRKKAS